MDLKAEAIDRARELECPVCFEVMEQSYAMVPCGHVICAGCNRKHLGHTCFACQGTVDRHQKLYK